MGTFLLRINRFLWFLKLLCNHGRKNKREWKCHYFWAKNVHKSLLKIKLFACLLIWQKDFLYLFPWPRKKSFLQGFTRLQSKNIFLWRFNFCGPYLSTTKKYNFLRSKISPFELKNPTAQMKQKPWKNNVLKSVRHKFNSNQNAWLFFLKEPIIFDNAENSVKKNEQQLLMGRNAGRKTGNNINSCSSPWFISPCLRKFFLFDNNQKIIEVVH